jgi:integrase
MLFKRKNYWYYKFTIGGKTVYRSTGTNDKTKAQEIADKARAKTWDHIKGGEKQTYIWQEAVVRYLQEADKKSINDDKSMLRWLSQHLDNKYLHDIDKAVIESIIDAKLKEGVSKTRVNRITTVINTILNKSVKEWQWLDTKPHIRKFKEADTRIRWLTQDEARRLLSELPKHLEAMARFSLSTGLRESNVTGLQWSQLDMQRRCAWIHADQAKAKKAIGVPLNDDALAVIRGQIGNHHTHVFAYQGKPVKKAGTQAWHKALRRAGIEQFRWHDLRHTWASWHVQNGTPLHILKELGGWSSYEMVERYAHLSPEHLAEFAENAKVAKSVAGKTVVLQMPSKQLI